MRVSVSIASSKIAPSSKSRLPTGASRSDADAQRGGILGTGGDEGGVIGRRVVRIAGLGSGHDLEHQRAIDDGARHGAVRGEPLPGVVGRGCAARRDRASACGRRRRSRPPGCGSSRRHPSPGRACRCPRRARRPPRRSSRRPCATDRAGLRVAPNSSFSVVGRTHLGRVRLADQHRPGTSQPGNAGGVGGRHVAGERTGAVGRRIGRGVGQILGRERHAVQRPAPDMRQAVALARLGDGPLAIPRHDGVDARILGLELLERDPAGLLGRDLAHAAAPAGV